MIYLDQICYDQTEIDLQPKDLSVSTEAPDYNHNAMKLANKEPPIVQFTSDSQ